MLDAPAIWLPPKPAIIRRATKELLKPPFSSKWAMMPGFVPIPSAAPVPASVSYQTHSENTANASSYNFTTQAFGTAAADRYVIVSIGRGAAGASALSSCTVGGVTATQFVSTLGAFNQQYLDLVYAAVPTGTTGTVAITFSASAARCAITIWAVYGLSSITPVDTATASTASSGAYTATLDVDVQADGVVIGCAYGGSNPTVTWTGATERHDTLVESINMHSGADATIAANETPRQVRCAFTAAMAGGGGISVSLR